MQGRSGPFRYMILLLFFITKGYAIIPMWTFTPDPDYPPKIAITPLGSAVIQYQVSNQSAKTRTLAMTPIAGIRQNTDPGYCPNPFTLARQQSCILSLQVSGSALMSDVFGGPEICIQGSRLTCYQPGPAAVLQIRRIPVAEYVITPGSEAHGTINPSSDQRVLAGSSLRFTAQPDIGYAVDQWLVDDQTAQRGGTQFTLFNIRANHRVEVRFRPSGSIYAGTEAGYVYFSSDNGLTWVTTTAPAPGFSVNGVFVAENTLYAGSADGKVYYSLNNGVLWQASSVISGGVAVKSLFVTEINGHLTIYAGLQNGNLYYSADAVNWQMVSNPGSGPLNGIFITPSQVIYIASEDGHVYYSTNNGSTWTSIQTPGNIPVHNVFAAGDQLYINTRQISSNSTLPPGTIDFEYAYTSNSLTHTNPVWTLFSQISYTLFVNADGSLIHAGTQDGHVFSLSNGDALGFISYSPINSLFFAG